MHSKFNPPRSKKALEMGINMVILMIIALAVLLIVGMFLTGGFGETSAGIGQMSGETTAEAESGRFGTGVHTATRLWACDSYACRGTGTKELWCVMDDGTENKETTCSNVCVSPAHGGATGSACCSDGTACVGKIYSP